MFMFFPFGVFSKEVIDPDVIGDEFQEALRTASATTHYQWTTGSVDSLDKLDASKLCNVHVKRVNASFQPTSYGEQLLAADSGTLAADSTDHDLNKNANTWLIPYNRGFNEVGGGDVSVSWPSEYPELVLSCFSFQYIRWQRDWVTTYEYWDTGVTPRVQIRIEVDGGRIPGTGPYSTGVDSQYRGQGISDSAIRSAVFSCDMLSAGDHSITASASQSSAIENQFLEQKYLDNGPIDGVAICQRSMTVIRLAMGGKLGS